jgi:hypothetical protein
MPLTKKGKKIMAAMKSEYGPEKGERVFYASKNKGRIRGVEKHMPGMSVHPIVNCNEAMRKRSMNGF